MKNKSLTIIIVLVIIAILGLAIFWSYNKNQKEYKYNITTTFYPQYIALMNIIGDDVSDIKYDILNDKLTGCLHHYTITTADMKKLESSDVIVINGAGMEETMEEYIEGLNKKTIDASADIETVMDEDEENPHTFLGIDNYIVQVENITEELIKLDPENKDVYEKNSNEYIQKLEELKEYAMGKLSNLKENKIITLHTSLDYFAKENNLDVIATIEGHEEEEPSAKQIKELVDLIKENNIKYIFNEDNKESKILQSIVSDTGIKINNLNTITGGKLQKDEYITQMKQNIDVIAGALNE